MAYHELVITANFLAYISIAPLGTNAEHSSWHPSGLITTRTALLYNNGLGVWSFEQPGSHFSHLLVF